MGNFISNIGYVDYLIYFLHAGFSECNPHRSKLVYKVYTGLFYLSMKKERRYAKFLKTQCFPQIQYTSFSSIFNSEYIILKGVNNGLLNDVFLLHSLFPTLAGGITGLKILQDQIIVLYKNKKGTFYHMYFKYLLVAQFKFNLFAFLVRCHTKLFLYFF